MLIENLGWFMLGSGVAALGLGCAYMAIRFMAYRVSKRKFFSAIEQLNKTADALRMFNSSPEVSELTFRDRMGVLNKVKIIVDPKLDDIDPPEEAMRCKVEETPTENIQEFIFSAQAVADMKAQGIEPDEVVTKMLKASGRMPS